MKLVAILLNFVLLNSQKSDKMTPTKPPKERPLFVTRGGDNKLTVFRLHITAEG